MLQADSNLQQYILLVWFSVHVNFLFCLNFWTNSLSHLPLLLGLGTDNQLYSWLWRWYHQVLHWPNSSIKSVESYVHSSWNFHCYCNGKKWEWIQHSYMCDTCWRWFFLTLLSYLLTQNLLSLLYIKQP